MCTMKMCSPLRGFSRADKQKNLKWTQQIKNSNWQETEPLLCTSTTRGLFLESPETFRAYFGWHNSLCIFKTKAFRGTKLCSYFCFSSLYNMWKDQLYRISRSYFYEWLFGPEKFSGLSRNGPQALVSASRNVQPNLNNITGGKNGLRKNHKVGNFNLLNWSQII